MLFTLQRLLQVGKNSDVLEQLPDERLERLRRDQFVCGPGERIFWQNFPHRFLSRLRQLRKEQRGLTELLFLELRDYFEGNVRIF